ncbi:WD40 repeat domain-containing protein [Microcoleus sp. bin48.metabat.b7b8b9.023]|uniref:WD40 repeat domain-containing protein n=1 Tax=Microcoleus sp. bin48.metabat.b7b8b9.023 TaxID=2742710 RepID=UPI0025FA22C1|nr:WD40 repeat domain-containing protein [Microcoleus sp. bin48.metabat.b7b8b9.023]
MFQTPNWQCVHTLHGHSSSVTSVVITPDGQTIVSGSSDSTIKLWNLNTGEEIHTLAGHSQGVTSITLSPDGQTLASGSKDATIKLWNLSNKEEIYTINGHSNIITSVAISPDEKTLASASEDTTIKLWNLSNGKQIRTLKWPVEIYYGLDILFSPDGKILVSSSGDDYVSLSAVAFNLATGDEIWTKHWKEGMDSVYAIAVSPDAENFATLHSRGNIKLWNLYTGAKIYTLAETSMGDFCLAFSPDGKILASGGWDSDSEDDSREPGIIELWNLDAREKLCSLLGHSWGVYSVAFSPDGQTLVEVMKILSRFGKEIYKRGKFCIIFN